MIGRRSEAKNRLKELRSVDLFAECSDEELRMVEGLGARIQIPAGTRLMSEGAGARECYVLIEGTAAVSSGGETITMLGPGSLVGEMALLNGRPRNATVGSVTPLSVILFHHGEFARLMRIPRVEAKVRSLISERITGTTITPHRRLQVAPELATA